MEKRVLGCKTWICAKTVKNIYKVVVFVWFMNGDAKKFVVNFLVFFTIKL